MSTKNKTLITVITTAALATTLHISNALEFKVTTQDLLKKEQNLGLMTAYTYATSIISSNDSILEKILFYGEYTAAKQYKRNIEKIIY